MSAPCLSWIELRPCGRVRPGLPRATALAANPATLPSSTHHRTRRLALPSFSPNLHPECLALTRRLIACAAVGPNVARPGPSNCTGGLGEAAAGNGSGASDAFNAVLDNSSIVSMDWNDWMSSSSSSTDGGEVLLPADFAQSFDGGEPTAISTAAGARTAPAGGADAASGSRDPAAAATAAAAAAATVATVRIAFYAVASTFDRRQLEIRLKAEYGSLAVRKYPDVIHCQISRSRGGSQPSTDVFFFDYGVVACWGLSAEAERDLARNLAVECAVQPLPAADQEYDVFRCTFATNPIAALADPRPPATAAPEVPSPAAATAAATAATAAESAAAAAAAASMFDGEPSATSSTGGSTSSRRFTRRAERIIVPISTATTVPPPAVAAAAAAGASASTTGGLKAAEGATPSAATPPLPPPAGPYSVLYFPPQIANDTVLLHIRHCGDLATLLAVSYALAQSTKMSAFEKAVETLVADTSALPEALAEHGLVHLSSKEIGRLIGKVFVLKRSVNLISSVTTTPEFFWYAPDELQALYSRITEYVELTARVEQLNGRFAVLQEMLELLRAQEENRHGNRLELVVIWLIVVEVVLGFFELLELFGVIGPKHGF